MIEENIGKDIVELLKDKLDREGITATGNLKESVHYVISPNVIEVWAEKYATYIDSGTKPHWVGEEGVEKIKIWASIRGINAWGVITNIRLYGTKPHPYLDELLLPIDIIIRSHMNVWIQEFQTIKVYQELRDAFNKQ